MIQYSIDDRSDNPVDIRTPLGASILDTELGWNDGARGEQDPVLQYLALPELHELLFFFLPFSPHDCILVHLWDSPEQVERDV